MGLETMKPGDLVRLRHLRHFTGDQTKFEADYRAPRGRVFVCLLVGDEAFDTTAPDYEMLDFRAVFNRLGWWSEDQIIKHAEKGEELVRKMMEAK